MAELWYYTCDGKQRDPVGIAELQRLVADGTLKPADMVWKEGLPRWIRASSLKELFPSSAATLDPMLASPRSAPAANGAGDAATALPAREKPVASAYPNHSVPVTEVPDPQAHGRRRRPGGESDRRPARRSANQGSGSNLGIIIALVLGAGVLLAGLAVGIVILLAPTDRPITDSRPAIVVQGVATETASIPPNTIYSRLFKLRKNVDYEVTVRSEPRQPDVDLFIYDRNGLVQASDDTPGPDSLIQKWRPVQDGEYRFELKNLDFATTVKSVLTIRELVPAKEVFKDNLPPGVLKGKDVINDLNLMPGQAHVFRLRVKAHYLASIAVKNHTKNRSDVDFNIHILKDSDDTEIAADVRPEADARVEFRRDADEIVRVRLHNASKSATARCTVLIDGGR